MQQGDTTDYLADPMELRRQLEPMSPAVLRRFHKILDHLKSEMKGEEINSTRDLYDRGVDEGLFTYGPGGELRLAKGDGGA